LNNLFERFINLIVLGVWLSFDKNQKKKYLCRFPTPPFSKMPLAAAGRLGMMLLIKYYKMINN
jgi:hypothetical protein